MHGYRMNKLNYTNVLTSASLYNSILFLIPTFFTLFAGELLNEWPDVSCGAHTLQLAINEGFKLEDLHQVIRKVSNLVAHFRRSTVACSALQSAQDRLNLPKHRLIQYKSTR